MKINKEGKSMSYVVAVNSSGQATIPKAIREFLMVEPGKNRIVFEEKSGKIILKREKTPEEMLNETLEKIWAMNEEEERRNPEVKALRKKYAGMTFNEVRDAYDATPEGRREFREKYGFDIKA